jgi:hypothetical protein
MLCQVSKGSCSENFLWKHPNRGWERWLWPIPSHPCPPPLFALCIMQCRPFKFWKWRHAYGVPSRHVPFLWL